MAKVRSLKLTSDSVRLGQIQATLEDVVQQVKSNSDALSKNNDFVLRFCKEIDCVKNTGLFVMIQNFTRQLKTQSDLIEQLLASQSMKLAAELVRERTERLAHTRLVATNGK